MGADDEPLPPAVIAMVDGDDVAGLYNAKSIVNTPGTRTMAPDARTVISSLDMLKLGAGGTCKWVGGLEGI